MKANNWLALLLFGALFFFTPSLNAQQSESARTEHVGTNNDDDDDDNGKWGLLGLVGLLGLLGLKKRDDDDRRRTTTTVNR